MTTVNDEARLGRLEGRVEDQAAAMQETRQDMRSGFQQVNARLDRMDAKGGQAVRRGQADSHTDWLSLATLGMVAVQIGLVIALIARGG